MPRIVLLICGLLLVFQARSQSLSERLQAALDTIYADNSACVGILAHVEAPGMDLSWSGASGYADQTNEHVLEADQPFLIASSIKPYVSATILRLVEMRQLSLEAPIRPLLTKATRKLFEGDGYDLSVIQIQHLLSHTSGFGFQPATLEDYFTITNDDKSHRWTRRTQYEYFIEKEDPKGPPGETFRYIDVNYVLLTEIIQELYGKPFYTAIRELLRYEEIGLDATWFPTLEEQPQGVQSLVHQYWGERNWDSADIDISWDLYGGGGIAATSKDLARFMHHYFQGDIVQTDSIRQRIFTEIRTPETEIYPYFLGLGQSEYHGLMGYGHGGFWATTMLYFPSLDATISVCILERDQRSLRGNVLSALTSILKDSQAEALNCSEEIKAYCDDLSDFSGTILVAKDDEVISQWAYGLANREHEVPNELDTRYNLASISKLITAVTALQLQEKGLLDVQKTVGDYLPDYPNDTVRDSVTIHQLLTHTSGLPPFYGELFLESDKKKYESIEDFWDLFVFEDLRFSPGSAYRYGGGGFVVLALIIEAVTGQDYYDVVAQNVFAQAGMKDALAIPVDSIVSRKADGYTCLWGDQDFYSRNDHYVAKASPAGGHYATTQDLFLFAKGLRDGTLLQPATRDLLLTPRVRGYNTHLGYGIDIDQRYNEQIVGHSGGWFGVRTELMDFLGSNYTVVVLSNQDDDGKSGASKVIDDLKEIIAGKL